MNIQSIVITNGIGIALTIIIAVSSTLSRRRRSLDSLLFSGMLFHVALACFMECAAFLVDGQSFAGAFFLL